MALDGKQSPGPVQQNHSRDFQSPRRDRSSDPTMHSGSAGSLMVLSMGSPHLVPRASPVCNGGTERSFYPRTRVDIVKSGIPLEQMTRQCLSHKRRSRSSYSWGRNSPKSRVSVVRQATWPTGIGQMSTGSQPTVSTLGKQPGEHPPPHARPKFPAHPQECGGGVLSAILFVSK